ncbi:MaoC/PaaZ C-terminal domain-containing protein [Pseudonocardia nematodicida]|uniref:MaoC/PaaZ C-terminal domain-containing protein n=1 Tax=Pseudonocardia nematodicida TaxID=1206997 RepID=A0ABV1KC45_9PSEU
MATTELPAPPALGPLYARAALGAVRGGRAGHGGSTTLPDVELVRRDVTVDPSHLADYARVCGFRVGDTLPLTYPHLLTFPLQVALMADRSFPLALPGMVHLTNRITAHRAIATAEALDVRVHAERFAAHPQGAQVDLVGTVSAGDETVWQGRSTYLARGARAPDGATAPAPAGIEAPTGSASALWRVPADAGRRYAAVSGDVNPIHLHPLAARAMGFPRAIAHGMWTAARAVASLEGRLPDAVTYDVRFRKPVLLPARVELVTAHDSGGDDGWRLAVRSARTPDRLHLVGRVGT